MDFGQISSILLVIFGFGFVIFWHELGHFLAAKWADVRVDQFAVGFGQAILSWRKGMGVRVGSTYPEYEKRAREYIEKQRGLNQDQALAQAATEEHRIIAAADALGLGETEYRLNWIPLGGYVKMLGQDDLHPNAQQDHPRAYNKKPIGQRMIIVSAGVVMNIILAAILFFVLFQMGFNVPPAVVGQMQPHSPAQHAGMQIGDEILYFNGKRQHDFTKITLNVALVDPNAEVPVIVRGPDGMKRELKITAARQEVEPHGFLMLGIEPPKMLAGLDPKIAKDLEIDAELVPSQLLLVEPGEVVTAINGQAVDFETDMHVLDRAVQQSFGRPVVLTVKDAGGSERVVEIEPSFLQPFGGQPLRFAGMEPRPRIERILPNSPARGKLMPHDVVTAIINRSNGDKLENLSAQKLVKQLGDAGQNDVLIDLVVVREGEVLRVEEISPSARLGGGRKGLSVQLSYEEERAVVVDVQPDSAAYRAGVPIGATITAIGDEPVQSWYDVHRILLNAPEDAPVTVTAQTATGQRQYEMTLSADERQELANHRYYAPASLAFRERNIERHTSNPFVAAWWGVGETRDLIIQFYLTLRRMVTGDISYKNMMGPVGIFSAGTKFAYRGNDWLIWFLAMISANLAVVNFLPIPIVDGGLFAFLIIEKISGKPISPRMQSVAQVVGLALILSIFLLVTYQDILRIGNF